MYYISNSKLEFIFEYYLKLAYDDLRSARLRGLFKEEFLSLGKIDSLEKIIRDLNLNVDVDKLKI